MGQWLHDGTTAQLLTSLNWGVTVAFVTAAASIQERHRPLVDNMLFMVVDRVLKLAVEFEDAIQ